MHRHALLFVLLLALSGRAVAQTLDIINHKGRGITLSEGMDRRFLVVVDSAAADSTWPADLNVARSLDEAVSAPGWQYWHIDSIDARQGRVAFRRSNKDDRLVWFAIANIRALKPKPTFGGELVTGTCDVLFPVFFFGGMIGAAYGLIALPVPSTPVEDDLVMLGGSVGAMGIGLGLGMLRDHIHARRIYRIRDTR